MLPSCQTDRRRVKLRSNLCKTHLQSIKELITSATTLGALIGSLAAGMLSDWTGRKVVLAVSDVIFIGGAIGQAVCHDTSSMVSLGNDRRSAFTIVYDTTRLEDGSL